MWVAPTALEAPPGDTTGGGRGVDSDERPSDGGTSDGRCWGRAQTKVLVSMTKR